MKGNQLFLFIQCKLYYSFIHSLLNISSVLAIQLLYRKPINFWYNILYLGVSKSYIYIIFLFEFGGIMKLKKKLSLGLGFLFVIIFALAIFCSYYIQKLSKESDNILRDNYESIVYSKKMFLALDDMKNSISNKLFNSNKDIDTSKHYLNLFEAGKTEFDKNLKAENNNITEINEKEYVEMLNKHYVVFLNLCRQINRGRGDNTMYFNEFLPAYEKLKQTINNINDINMQAVVRKNLLTKQHSSNIMSLMAIIGTICIILAFGYFWYFPFYISNSLS